MRKNKYEQNPPSQWSYRHQPSADTASVIRHIRIAAPSNNHASAITIDEHQTDPNPPMSTFATALQDIRDKIRIKT